VVNGAGGAAQATEVHPRMIAIAEINFFIADAPVPTSPAFFSLIGFYRQNSPKESTRR
jgi:hypothetical protein